MAIGLWNGIVYVAGGSPDIGATVVNTLYAYDIAANSWTTTLAHMPQGSWVSGFGIINGPTGQSCTLPVAATVSRS